MLTLKQLNSKKCFERFGKSILLKSQSIPRNDELFQKYSKHPVCYDVDSSGFVQCPPKLDSTKSGLDVKIGT